MVWYFHLFKNIPQFVVIHTVKGFSIVNEAEDVFLEFPCFFYDPAYVGNLISGSSEYIMWNARLDESQAGIKTGGENINNLRYADNTTLMAESEEKLKSFSMKVKEEGEKNLV